MTDTIDNKRGKKPTIEELERLMDEPDQEVSILPNGEVRVLGHGDTIDNCRRFCELRSIAIEQDYGDAAFDVAIDIAPEQQCLHVDANPISLVLFVEFVVKPYMLADEERQWKFARRLRQSATLSRYGLSGSEVIRWLLRRTPEQHLDAALEVLEAEHEQNKKC